MKIRFAFVGGGQGSFIGPAAHLPALLMDNGGLVVAGAFSRSPEKSREAAAKYEVDPSRCYANWREMLATERERSNGANAIAVVTPNDLHVPVCTEAWQRGYHVITDKPLSDQLESAQRLYDLVSSGDGKQIFGVTHNYTRNPMAVMATELVRDGKIGRVHTVESRYRQGWLATPLELDGQKQASWRTDPKQAGAGAWGDIGTHAFIQALQLGQLKPKRISARLRTVVEGRQIDDDGTAIIECHGGAIIRLTASQVLQGHANNFDVEVHGTTGSLYWRQEDPDYLWLRRNGEPEARYQRNASAMTPIAGALCRVPGGHPEAYLEGFGNVYRQFIQQVLRATSGAPAPTDILERAPGIEVGLAGNLFIDASQTSSEDDGAWVEFDHPIFAA